MDTTTINGLHACKPGNEPKIGQIKSFVVEQKTGKSGKPYLKIRSANAENGGTPHRILSAEPTGFTDNHGNISFNIEIETAIQQGTGNAPPYRPGIQNEEGDASKDWPEAPESHKTDPQSPPARSNGGDGVTEARKHLMQSANLYNLCVAAVDKAIAPWMPEVARTSEQFQAAVASLYIEASKEQWWSGKIVKPSLIDSMPTTPIKIEKPAPPPDDDDQPPF